MEEKHESAHNPSDIPQCDLMGTVYQPGSTRGASNVTVTATPIGEGSERSTTTGSDGTYTLPVDKPEEVGFSYTYSVNTPDVFTIQGAQLEVVKHDTTQITGINFNEILP